MNIPTPKAGWSIAEWSNATGLSRATIYRLIAAHRLRTAKIGARRIVIEAPQAWLDSISGGMPHDQGR